MLLLFRPQSYRLRVAGAKSSAVSGQILTDKDPHAQLPHIVLFAAVVCLVLLYPNPANADSLTGSVGITWLFPDTSTVFGADTIAVGSAWLAPMTHPRFA